MAKDINDVVDVTINVQASTPSRVGFGTPLIFGFHSKFAERARVVTSLTELSGLGFDAEDPEYKLASSLLSQSPSPDKLVIGRSILTPAYNINLLPVEQDSTGYTVAVDNADATFTSDATATVVEITAGLKSAIDFIGKSVEVTDNGTDLDIEPRAAFISSNSEPYNLVDGDTLLISIDGEADLTATFAPADFVAIGTATAAEIVAVLNTDWVGGTGSMTASAVTDPTTSKTKVRVVNDSAGFTGRTLKVTDGAGNPNTQIGVPTGTIETQSAFVFQNKTRRLTDTGGFSLLQANDTTADPGDLGADLTAIQGENNDWYAVLPTMGSKNIISNGSSDLITAVTSSTSDKILITSTMDHDVITDTAGNIGELLFDASRDRGILIWHSEPLSYPCGAWAGLQLPKDPGSTTWKFKTLSGIVADDILGAEFTALDANNVNRYISIAGISMMERGLASKSQFFIDIRRFIDFLKARMGEAVFTRLSQLEKIPFTDAGIAIVENEVRGTLQLGIRVGGLASDPAPTVFVPKAADVSVSDKSNRILPDVTFTATLAGAIHKVVINGTVTV